MARQPLVAWDETERASALYRNGLNHEAGARNTLGSTTASVGLSFADFDCRSDSFWQVWNAVVDYFPWQVLWIEPTRICVFCWVQRNLICPGGFWREPHTRFVRNSSGTSQATDRGALLPPRKLRNVRQLASDRWCHRRGSLRLRPRTRLWA